MICHLKLGEPVDYGAYAVEKRLKKVSKYIDFANKKVLDIGCGNGAYTVEIAKDASLAVGIDIEPERLSVFNKTKGERKIRNVYISLMSGEYIGFKGGVFDIVILIETLEHILNERNCLRECWRVLKENGKIILYVPNKWFPFETHGIKLGLLEKYSKRIPFISWLPNKILQKIAFARSYTSKKITKLLEEEGFHTEVIDWFYPPLDKIKIPIFLKKFYRRYLVKFLEESPLRIFGVSILVIGEKVNGGKV